MNRFDRGARLVFHFAREESERLGHTMVGPEHLLLGLLREGGAACAVLQSFGLTLEGARHRVAALFGVGPGLPRGEVASVTSSTRLVMVFASSEARALGHRKVHPEHLLLGILRSGEGPAFGVLRDVVADPSAIRRRILETALPDADLEGDAPPAFINVGALTEAPAGINSLSPVMGVRLELRLLGRRARHLLLGR